MSCVSIKSLEVNYSANKLRELTISWLDKYLPWLSKKTLCSYFEYTFKDSASLYEIGDNVKDVMEGLMIKYYHNESYIKATFVRELKKHKAISFFELPINNSRIDLCSINGNSVAYEIKTKYDNLKRLSKQIDDYLKAFEYVYVICSNDKTEDVLSIVPDNVGVYEYDDNTSKVKFIMVKEAERSKSIEKKSQMSILRKSEIPDNVDCLNDEEINSIFKQCLKNRYRKKWNTFCKECSHINMLDYQATFNKL